MKSGKGAVREARGPAAWGRSGNSRYSEKEGQKGQPKVVLFLLRSAHLARYYEPSIRLLAGRGHAVHIAFPFKAAGGDHFSQWQQAYAPLPPATRSPEDAPDAFGAELLSGMAHDYANISWGYLRQRREDEWQDLLTSIRLCHDYVRYFDDAFSDAAVLRERALAYGIPGFFQSLMERRFMRSPMARRIIRRFLAGCQAATPISKAAVEEILEISPDIILVSRMVDFTSPQDDYVRAAHYLGIPVGLPVASWDNLTNKGLVKVVPDFVTVWNDHQKKEAVELHGLPKEKVRTTGAQVFDAWFDHKPSRTREEFCRQVGLDPDEALIAYLGSSKSIARDEVAHFRRWLTGLRQQEDRALSRAGVVVRPHPYHVEQWEEADLSDLGRVEIWPRSGAIAIARNDRDDFYDTLFHASAVVGLNTSALLEAAIIGRPVFVLVGEDRGGTLETLHFRYLADPERGIAHVSQSAEAHFSGLREAVAGAKPGRNERFLRDFLRPHGLERSAAPILADAIEEAAISLKGKRPRAGTGPLRMALRAVLHASRGPLVARQQQAAESGRQQKKMRQARDQARAAFIERELELDGERERGGVQGPEHRLPGASTARNGSNGSRLAAAAGRGASVRDKVLIPKIIHQIWVGADPLPEDYAALIAKIKAMHPDWEHRLWTEDNLPASTIRDEWRDRLRVPAERSDLLRLELLYQEGGVYLDVDFDFLRPLDPIRTMAPFVIADLNEGRVNNAFMAAVPHHPLIGAMIEKARPREVFGLDKGGSGPLFVDRMIAPYKNTSEVKVLPVAAFYGSVATDETFALHLWGRSWKREEEWREMEARAQRRMRAVSKRIAELEKALKASERAKDQLRRAGERVEKLRKAIEKAKHEKDGAGRHVDAARESERPRTVVARETPDRSQDAGRSGRSFPKVQEPFL